MSKKAHLTRAAHCAAIRTLMSFGNDFVTKYKRDSLRILGTVGEPINPEAWRWYHDVRPLAYNPKISSSACFQIGLPSLVPHGVEADHTGSCVLGRPPLPAQKDTMRSHF